MEKYCLIMVCSVCSRNKKSNGLVENLKTNLALCISLFECRIVYVILRAHYENMSMQYTGILKVVKNENFQ